MAIHNYIWSHTFFGNHNRAKQQNQGCDSAFL